MSRQVSRRGSREALAEPPDPFIPSSAPPRPCPASSDRQTGSTPMMDLATSPLHPLGALRSGDDDDNDSDISRPTLRRLTSETERQVAESSRSGASEGGSNRGSLDLLRMSSAQDESREVEVLVHLVKQNESLAGIALLYGIEVATLRKINKLWASDSVHLKTRLYVPIEACRWNKASETFIRGPCPGQITLVPKNSSSRKGKAPMRSPPVVSNAPEPMLSLDSPGKNGWDLEVDPVHQFLESTNVVYDRSSMDSIRPQILPSDDSPSRVVDVVRIPNSQLRFFPRPQKPPDQANGRHSLEHDMRRVSLDRQVRRSVSLRSGPTIQNDLHTLPPPLQPEVKSEVKKNVVKIRPPSSSRMKTSASTNSITDRLTSFFAIPDAPYGTLPGSPQRPRPRLDTRLPSATSSRRSSYAASPVKQAKEPDVLLEMIPRRGSAGTLLNGFKGSKLSTTEQRRKQD